MSRLSIQPFDLIYGTGFASFYIEVPEGSELLAIVTAPVEGDDISPKYVAWCIVDSSLPWTRRFFDFLMPGSHIANRADLVFITALDDGGLCYLLFENKAKRLAWLEETLK